MRTSSELLYMYNIFWSSSTHPITPSLIPSGGNALSKARMSPRNRWLMVQCLGVVLGEESCAPVFRCGGTGSVWESSVSYSEPGTIGNLMLPGACPAVWHATESLGRLWSMGHPTLDIADVVLEKEFAFVKLRVLLLVFWNRRKKAMGALKRRKGLWDSLSVQGKPIGKRLVDV